MIERQNDCKNALCCGKCVMLRLNLSQSINAFNWQVSILFLSLRVLLIFPTLLKCGGCSITYGASLVCLDLLRCLAKASSLRKRIFLWYSVSKKYSLFPISIILNRAVPGEQGTAKRLLPQLCDFIRNVPSICVIWLVLECTDCSILSWSMWIVESAHNHEASNSKQGLEDFGRKPCY